MSITFSNKFQTTLILLIAHRAIRSLSCNTTMMGITNEFNNETRQQARQRIRRINKRRITKNSSSSIALQLLFVSMCLLTISQQQNQSSLDYFLFPMVNGQPSSSSHDTAMLRKCNADAIAEADSNIHDGSIDADEYRLLLFELAPSSCNILDAYDDNSSVILDQAWTVLTCACKQSENKFVGNNNSSNDGLGTSNFSADSCCDAAAPHFTIPGNFTGPCLNRVCSILDRAISAECDRQKTMQKQGKGNTLEKQQQRKTEEESNNETMTEEYSPLEPIDVQGESSNPQNNGSKDPTTSSSDTSINIITGSPPKSMAVAIAPKFTALLSISGSLVIIARVLSKASRRNKPMHRIMLGMSVSDFLASVWYFVGTFAIPAKTLSWFGNEATEAIFWAAGDQEGISCAVAGFFNQFAVATVLYNLTLAVYYLLVVKHGWKNHRIAKIEWIFHLVPLGYACVTSAFAAASDLYGHVEWTCWILPNELFDDAKDLTIIQSKFQWIQWIFLFGVVWMCIIVNTIIFVILYRIMKKLERKMKSYAIRSSRHDIPTTNTVSSRASGWFHLATPTSKKNTTPKKEGIIPMKSDTSNNDNRIIDAEKGSANNREVYRDREEEENDSDSDDDEGSSSDADDDDDEHDNGTECDSAAHVKTTSDGCQWEEEAQKVSSDCFTLGASSSSSQKGGKMGSIIRRFSSFASGEQLRHRGNEERTKDARSKKIAVQGLLYVGAFYVTWLFPTVSRITELSMGRNFFWIQFLDTSLIPLQGFFNLLIYLRPSLLKHRKQNPDIGFFKALKTVVVENKD